MRYIILVLAFLLPMHAWAQTQPSSTRITNSNGSVAAAVQSTATAGTEAGLVVRVAGTVATTGGSSASSTVNAANSSTATLGAGATFTGTGVSVLTYDFVEVLVASNVASASNGLQIQFSSDNTNWDDASVYTYTPGTAPNVGQIFGAGARGQYVRVVYTNGGTIQGSFRLQTILKVGDGLGDTVSVNTDITGSTHATMTRASILGRTTAGGGAYVDVKVNPSGALTADVTQSGTWSSRTQDGAGNSIASTTATPDATDRGFVVRQAPGASVVSGQQAVTASAVALPSVAVRQVCVTHITGGTVGTIYVGPTGVTTSTGFALDSGMTACVPTDNVSDLFVVASGTGSSVAYLGVP